MVREISIILAPMSITCQKKSPHTSTSLCPGQPSAGLAQEGAYADGRVVLEARAAGRCVLCRWRHSQIPVRKLFSIALAPILLSLASSSQPRLPSRLKAV